METAKRRRDLDREEYRLDRDVESRRAALASFCVHALERARDLDAVLVVLRADEPEALERAARVADACSRLAHPALARVHATFRAHGVPFQIVEDFRDSRSLAGLVAARGPAHWQEAAALVRALASALDLVHGAGLVHAGLSPGSIFLDRAWRPKLALDARLLAFADVPGPATPAPFGAPEDGLAGARVPGNLYSLGALLYTLLVGGTPAAGSPAPRAVLAEIPEVLERLVLDLLAPEPARRPASAAEVVARLDALVP